MIGMMAVVVGVVATIVAIPGIRVGYGSGLSFSVTTLAANQAGAASIAGGRESKTPHTRPVGVGVVESRVMAVVVGVGIGLSFGLGEGHSGQNQHNQKLV